MKVTQDISKTTIWNLPTLITFRFFFAYFFLNIFPFPLYYLDVLVGQEDLFSFYFEWFNQLSIWAGENILGIEYEIITQTTGSGDKTVNYLSQFVMLIIASIATIIWSVLDSKKRNYQKLFLYSRTYVRYYIITIMFSYGFSKAFTLQFSELSLFDLIKPYGDSSPMGLMWNFMEYSDTYTRFSGYAEIIAGVLLIFRKTVLLGALMTIAVMFNIFMMNMSYDIPVKLYSWRYMIMGVYLLVPDFKRVLDFLIFNKSVQKKVLVPYFINRKFKIAGIVFKISVLCFLFYYNINRCIEGQQKWGKKAPKSALYGIYEVKHFIRNDDTIPPLTTDTIRWKRLIIDKRYGGIQTMDEKIKYIKEETDTILTTLKLVDRKDSTDTKLLSYKLKDSLYIFKGIYKCDTLKIVTKKKEREEYLLINRGFHWISERPYNR